MHRDMSSMGRNFLVPSGLFPDKGDMLSLRKPCAQLAATLLNPKSRGYGNPCHVHLTFIPEQTSAEQGGGQQIDVSGAPHDIHAALILVLAAAVHERVRHLRILEASEQLYVATFPESVQFLC